MSGKEAIDAAGLVLASAAVVLAVGLVAGIDPSTVALLVVGFSIIMGVVVTQRAKRRQASPGR